MTREGDSTVVRFASVHLRPGATEPLPTLYLGVAAERASEIVQIGWRATSTSAESWVEGTLEMPVGAEPIDISPVPGQPDEDD